MLKEPVILYNYRKDSIEEMQKKISEEKERNENVNAVNKSKEYNLYVYMYWLKVELRKEHSKTEGEINKLLDKVNYFEDKTGDKISSLYYNNPTYWAKYLVGI